MLITFTVMAKRLRTKQRPASV